ncbi:hypothetical protein VaNZ11_012417 [Volvox africanus]|uniref:tRNA (guanine(46)-N(7))-methyltransferase n=1 Tax=Volvox africanus TaxID=51714 RepID=A0ABQ5SF36_9CHLO|nr:hypothetical protein VaNZ11_012417 [Volvox africanus]
MQAGGAIGRRNYSFLMRSDGQQPVKVAEWGVIYEDSRKPLVVDLGCGAGRYVLLMALRKGLRNNYLGVDVHKALLDRANGWAAARSLSSNVHFLQANAVASASVLLGSYPGPIELVSIQYPDPQQRRQRHIVGRELVEALARVLRPGAHVYLASDFEDTSTYMRNAFEVYGNGRFRVDDVHTTQAVFPCGLPNTMLKARDVSSVGTSLKRESLRARASGDARDLGPPSVASVGLCQGSSEDPVDSGQEGRAGDSGTDDELLCFQGSWQQAGWLQDNPVGVPTEREVYVEKATKGRVYRILLVRS